MFNLFGDSERPLIQRNTRRTQGYARNTEKTIAAVSLKRSGNGRLKKSQSTNMPVLHLSFVIVK